VGKKSEQTPDVQPEESVAAEQEEAVTAEVADEMSPEEQLQAELSQAQNEVKEHQERYLRTLADMENLRKRTQREKEELSKFANESILKEILPVIDNLERAVEHAEVASGTEGLLEGVQMTLTQFGQVLERFNVKAIDAVGEIFDPNLHQAMGQVESDLPVNSVVQQMQKGYQLNGRLLRPAMVMIAKAPAVVEEETDSSSDEDNQQ
jgi:molecular chaperone GrpE